MTISRYPPEHLQYFKGKLLAYDLVAHMLTKAKAVYNLDHNIISRII